MKNSNHYTETRALHFFSKAPMTGKYSFKLGTYES